jgi:hypothetical protein
MAQCHSVRQAKSAREPGRPAGRQAAIQPACYPALPAQHQRTAALRLIALRWRRPSSRRCSSGARHFPSAPAWPLARASPARPRSSPLPARPCRSAASPACMHREGSRRRPAATPPRAHKRAHMRTVLPPEYGAARTLCAHARCIWPSRRVGTWRLRSAATSLSASRRARAASDTASDAAFTSSDLAANAFRPASHCAWCSPALFSAASRCSCSAAFSRSKYASPAPHTPLRETPKTCPLGMPNVRGAGVHS